MVANPSIFCYYPSMYQGIDNICYYSPSQYQSYDGLVPRKMQTSHRLNLLQHLLIKSLKRKNFFKDLANRAVYTFSYLVIVFLSPTSVCIHLFFYLFIH